MSESKFQEHGERISALEKDFEYQNKKLDEISIDVKKLVNYKDQQVGAIKIVSLVSGVIGAIGTFLIQTAITTFRKH